MELWEDICRSFFRQDAKAHCRLLEGEESGSFHYDFLGLCVLYCVIFIIGLPSLPRVLRRNCSRDRPTNVLITTIVSDQTL